MKKPALILLFFIVFAAWLGAASIQANLGLYFGQQEAKLSQPVSIVNGSILVPLQLVTDYLGGRVTWSVKGEKVELEFPNLTITMHVGQESALVNSTSYRLDVPVEFSQGDLMVPLRFIVDHLGLSLGFDEKTGALVVHGGFLDGAGTSVPATSVHAPQPEPDLKDIIYIGGPRSRVFVDVAKYSGYQTMLLTNPDRLVLDLFGVSGDALPDRVVNGLIVQRIRSSLFDGNTVRIVFDLNAATGYKISPWPEGGLEVEFNHQLMDIGFERRDDGPTLLLEVTDRPHIEVINLVDPVRLVLDLHDTTLIGSAVEFAVDDPAVRRVRVSQNNPAVPRIVLELNAPVPLWDVTGGDGRYPLTLFEGTAAEAQAKREALAREALEREERLRAEALKQAAAAAASAEALPDVERDGPVAGRVIMIDPGHGGSDPGAIGPYGTFEKEVNLAIALLLGALLEEAGAVVHYTRTDDVYVSIFQRPLMAQEAGAEIFVSVHANAYLDEHIARGTETLYNPNNEQNKILAECLQAGIVQELQLYDRGLRKRTDLAVLNGSKIPAALVEVAFLNHPDEEVLLRAPGFQAAAAKGLYNGIARYFAEHFPKEE